MKEKSGFAPGLSGVIARLEELCSLRTGWLDGDGVELSREGVAWLRLFFEKLFPADIPFPYLYPTPEGDIQAEWSDNVSLKINLARHCAEFFCLTEEETLSLNLDFLEDRCRLFEKLRGICLS